MWVVRTPELSTRADPPANTSSSKPQHAHYRPLQLKQPQPSTNQYRVQSLLKPQPPKPSMQMRPNVPSMHLTSPSMQASYPQSKPQCGTALTTLSVSYRSSKQQTLTLRHGCKLRGAGARRGGGGRSGRRRAMHGRNTGGR